MAPVKAACRFLLLLLSCLIAIPIQKTVLLFTKGQISYLYPPVWHRSVLRIFGIKLEVSGQPVTGRQVLYVSNHLSYIDIAVLGSVVRGSFVSRGDVRDWPGWGFFGTLQQVQYISRKTTDVKREKDTLDRMVRDGKNLIMFAEGTSSDGAQVLPFKSSLFSLALDEAAGRRLTVQPITMTLLAVDGRPAATAAERDLYTWHGEMTLPPHFWRLAKLRGATVQVRFHPPREAADYPDRKALAIACQADVAAGLQTALARIGQTG